MAESELQCTDCEVALTEIKLIDKSHYGVHTDLEYALAESKRSFWTGKLPVEGNVLSYMCPECGRIYLYGGGK